MTYTLAAVGDNCIDYYAALNKGFPGGNPVNVAVYFTRLGGKASYTGAVGTDAYGTSMIHALTEKGVNTDHVKQLEGSTAVTQVTLEDGNRVFGDYDPGVLNQFKLTEQDIDFICAHDLVVSGLWGMIEDDLYKIKAKNTLIAFDFATKLDDPIVEKAIPFVDYAFFASDEDDQEWIREFMRQMHRRGPKIVVVTLGEKGSLAYDGLTFTKFGIIPCDVKDTMGAGDSYIAGFLLGILMNKPITDCMQMGAENSSVTLQYLGAW